MPRPKKLKAGVPFLVLFEAEQLEALKKVASATGSTVADLVREAVDLYLREASVQLGLKLALGEREPVERQAKQQKEGEQEEDPILEYRREKFRYELARFESALASTERKWKKILSELGTGYRHSRPALPADFLDEVDSRERWFDSMVRRYGDIARSPEFGERVRDLAERVLRLRKEVDRVREALRWR